MSRDLAGALAKGLHDAGVRMIFGMPGGGPNLDMIGCAEQLGIGFVLAHGETAACIMAASYGKLTDTPGTAVVTRGPGLTSATNGLAQATLDRFPLILVSDSVPQADAHWISHQRLDQVAVGRPITKWSGILGVAEPSAVVAAAAQLATQAPAGAVHLSFDSSVPGDAPPASLASPATDEATVERVRDLIAHSRRPVVVVGLDAARHCDDVRPTLAGLNCPLYVTYQAKGTVPDFWSNYAGLFTNSTLERPVLDQADLIVGIGVDPVELMPNPWTYAAPVVLLHGHPPLNGHVVRDPVVATIRYAEHLPRLLTACESSWPPGFGGDAHRRNLARLEAASDGLSPHVVVRETQHASPSGTVITVDAGAHMLVAMPLWQTDNPNDVLISNGLSTMGFALPAAIAAALAYPDRHVVCFVGDGGLGMVLAELETAARLQLDITVIVFNDASLSLIKLKQRSAQGGSAAVGFSEVDFASVARALGVTAFTVTDADSLCHALRTSTTGPKLIDAKIDASVYPHVLRVTRG